MNNYIQNLYPTAYHPAEFWEHLGRAVATFGFLEDILKRAVFALTTTLKYTDEEAEKELDKWSQGLFGTLTSTLNRLTELYQTAAESHNIDVSAIVEEIKKAIPYRDLVCHTSWPPPDLFGKSKPFFVHRKMEVFDSVVDIDFLSEVQNGATKIACDVVNSIIQNGLAFPGLTKFKNQA